MYIDTNLEFSDAQAVTATALSTNVYDALTIAGGGGSVGINGGTLTVDLGQAADIYLVVIATAAAAGGDAAKTLTITLESDDNAPLASSTVHFSTGAILGSAITAGARLVTLRLPHGAYQRYVGLRYTVSASFTSFTIDAFLTTDGNGVYRAGATNFVVI